MLGPQGHSQPGPGMALEQLLKPWDEGLTPACCLSRGRDAWARGSVGFPGNVPALPALRRERRGPECLRLGMTGSRPHTLTGLSASAGVPGMPGPSWWTPGHPGTKMSVGAALVVWGVKVQCGGGVQGETRAGGGGPE